MAIDLDSQADHSASAREWRVPEPKSRAATYALLIGLALFVINIGVIEYQFIESHGTAPSGFTAWIYALIALPTLALAVWLYASKQTLRAYLLCLFPPFIANDAAWGALILGHNEKINATLMSTVAACLIWLALLPALAAFANRITTNTPKRK